MTPRSRHSRVARARRSLPLAGVACGALVVVGAWLLTWWVVPLSALIATVLWWDQPRITTDVMWGAVAGWVVLLLIDSLHGRSWALARAAGGAVFLPWGLLFPVTLLFAAGLAWSAATVVRALCAKLAARA